MGAGCQKTTPAATNDNTDYDYIKSLTNEKTQPAPNPNLDLASAKMFVESYKIFFAANENIYKKIYNATVIKVSYDEDKNGELIAVASKPWETGIPELTETIKLASQAIADLNSFNPPADLTGADQIKEKLLADFQQKKDAATAYKKSFELWNAGKVSESSPLYEQAGKTEDAAEKAFGESYNLMKDIITKNGLGMDLPTYDPKHGTENV